MSQVNSFCCFEEEGVIAVKVKSPLAARFTKQSAGLDVVLTFSISETTADERHSSELQRLLGADGRAGTQLASSHQCVLRPVAPGQCTPWP